MTESKLQANCFIWFWNTHPGERYRFFHIRNEGTKNIIQGSINMATGLVKGAWDMLYLPENNKPVFIEFKSEKGSLTKEQLKFRDANYGSANFYVIKSFPEFQGVIKEYLK